MTEFPPNLILLLKRFDIDYSTMTHFKSDCCVEVPRVLQRKARGSYYEQCFHFWNPSLYLTGFFLAEQEVRTVWDGEPHGQSSRWTLHSHRPVWGQHLVWVQWWFRQKGEGQFNFSTMTNIQNLQKEILFCLLKAAHVLQVKEPFAQTRTHKYVQFIPFDQVWHGWWKHFTKRSI